MESFDLAGDFEKDNEMSDEFEGLISRYANGVRLNVKAKPGASRPRAPKVVPLAEGGRAVEIAVAAPPEDGKANKAIVEALASHIGIKKGALSVKTGASGRLKIIEIEGDPEGQFERVSAWLKTLM